MQYKINLHNLIFKAVYIIYIIQDVLHNCLTEQVIALKRQEIEKIFIRKIK